MYICARRSRLQCKKRVATTAQLVEVIGGERVCNAKNKAGMLSVVGDQVLGLASSSFEGGL